MATYDLMEILADAAALATAYASLAGRVSASESKLSTRNSTCLVNAVGTGAPHETVASQLPANVVPNSRYVLPNPFGNNTPVIVCAELLLPDGWAASGYIYVNGGYGTTAHYVQGVGIVVKTGGIKVFYAEGGGWHTSNVIDATKAPCRVFVRKLEENV